MREVPRCEGVREHNDSGACVQFADFGPGDGDVSEDVVVEGDGSPDFVNELAGDAVSVGEDEDVRSGGRGLRGGPAGGQGHKGGEGNGE